MEGIIVEVQAVSKPFFEHRKSRYNFDVQALRPLVVISSEATQVILPTKSWALVPLFFGLVFFLSAGVNVASNQNIFVCRLRPSVSRGLRERRGNGKRGDASGILAGMGRFWREGYYML